MKDELIRKVQDVLDLQITTEMQIVYLMVELRKLMDRERYTIMSRTLLSGNRAVYAHANSWSAACFASFDG